MADNKDDDRQTAKPAGTAGLIGLALLAVSTAACAFALVFFFAPSPGGEAIAAACEPVKAADGYAATEENAEDRAFVQLEEFLITVGSAPATRYLKMNVAIATDKENAEAVANAEPMLIDSFNGYLRALSVSDFENPDTYHQMKDQLSKRAELVVGSQASNGVLITEFLLR